MGSRSRTAGAQAFAQLAQGIAQGLQGLQQKQGQQERMALERELMMLRLQSDIEDRKLRQQDIEGRSEDRRLDRENRQSEFADRMASDQENRSIRMQELEARIQDLKIRAEDRDLDREARVEAAKNRKKAEAEDSDIDYVMGTPGASRDKEARDTYRNFMAIARKHRNLDPDSLAEMLGQEKPAEFDLSKNQALRARIEGLNASLRTSTLPEIAMTGDKVALSADDLSRIIASDEFGDWKRHTTDVLEPALEGTRSMLSSIKMRPELARDLAPRALEVLRREAAASRPASQPTAMGIQESRESTSRAGNVLRARADAMTNATDPRLAPMFSTDPVQRVSSWMEMHTSGQPVLPPTIDFAVSEVDGVPQLKPDVAAMIEQAFPGQGKSMAANQLLQQLATSNQQMQQSEKQGLLQGPSPGEGSGERAASRAASRPQRQPAATTQRSQRDPADTRGYGARGR